MDEASRSQSPKISFLWSAFGPYRKLFLIVFAVILINALFNALGVGIILPILQFLLDPSAIGEVNLNFMNFFFNYIPKEQQSFFLACITMFIFAIKAVFAILTAYLSSYFTQSLRKYWSMRIATKYLYGEYKYVLSHKQGHLINNLLREPFSAASGLYIYIQFISTLFIALAIFSICFYVNWKIVCFVSMLIIFFVIFFRKVSSQVSISIGNKRVSFSQKITSSVAENIQAVKVIKAFSSEKLKLDQMNQIINKLCLLNVKQETINVLPIACSDFIIIIILLLGGGFMLAFHENDVRSFMPIMGFFVVAFIKLFHVSSNLFSMRMKALNRLPSLEMVHELSSEPAKVEDLEEGEPFLYLKSDVFFRQVDFCHEDGRHLFKNLNLRIPRGKLTFLIGPSGSGKSTLVELLLRLYTPDSGCIVVNGLDLDEINLRDWRSKIGYVGQDVFLFNGTIRENIMFGDANASEEEMKNAAKNAGIHDFISHLPKGYDTHIGDRGLTVSGGERQRISIARALIRKPELLLFDEGTGSLDQELERKIVESIKTAFHGKTILFITHRLETATHAHLIHVLEKGSIVSSGSYADIIGSKVITHRISS